MIWWQCICRVLKDFFRCCLFDLWLLYSMKAGAIYPKLNPFLFNNWLLSLCASSSLPSYFLLRPPSLLPLPFFSFVLNIHVFLIWNADILQLHWTLNSLAEGYNIGYNTKIYKGWISHIVPSLAWLLCLYISEGILFFLPNVYQIWTYFEDIEFSCLCKRNVTHAKCNTFVVKYHFLTTCHLCFIADISLQLFHFMLLQSAHRPNWCLFMVNADCVPQKTTEACVCVGVCVWESVCVRACMPE